MRRADREIKDRDEIIDVVKRCQVIRIAMIDEDGSPYMVPVNFGYEDKYGKLCFYIHSAKEGHKLDLLRRDSRVFFEMDIDSGTNYDPDKMMCTYIYESVMGKGKAVFLETMEEKIHDFETLMDHYYPGEKKPFDERVVAITEAIRIDVEEMTGKRRKVPKKD